MENEPGAEQPVPPHQDPELIAASHGDELLLHRLISLRQTQNMLARQPESESNRNLLELAEEDVKQRQRELGLIPPEQPEETK